MFCIKFDQKNLKNLNFGLLKFLGLGFFLNLKTLGFSKPFPALTVLEERFYNKYISWLIDWLIDWLVIRLSARVDVSSQWRFVQCVRWKRQGRISVVNMFCGSFLRSSSAVHLHRFHWSHQEYWLDQGPAAWERMLSSGTFHIRAVV